METIGRDKICAVVATQHSGSMWNQLQQALRQTRTVELRLDWLSSEREIHALLQRLAKRNPRATLIATCRRREVGGRFRGSIASQLLVLAEALQAGCAWYDLEIESISKCPGQLLDVLLGGGRRIASAHFFRASPANPRRAVDNLWKTRPDAIKIAASCDSLSTGVRLLRLARDGKRNTIVIPMGDIALPLRCLALRAGSALTYAPVENATAPGQVSLDALKNLFRADQISRKTLIYGVIGDPISHSLSPQLHNAGFQARKMDAVYFPFLVRDLRDFLGAVKPLGIRGFSITLPYKQEILRYLDSCDPLASAIGAVNTVVVTAAGNLYGYNTDYVGVLRTLQERVTLSQSRVLILGAGGAARAVAYALAQSGASVCICARRPKEAKKLARAVGGEEFPRPRLKSEFFDAIINATPVGMHPTIGDSPLVARELNCRLVFDLIYRPVTTKLLQLASRSGIEAISGLEMFLAQGIAQWEIWTGQRAPAAAMRKSVLDALRTESSQGKL
jgi:3-dehydroquinate dehydratase/shikimate dehydrogenase